MFTNVTGSIADRAVLLVGDGTKRAAPLPEQGTVMLAGANRRPSVPRMCASPDLRVHLLATLPPSGDLCQGFPWYGWKTIRGAG